MELYPELFRLREYETGTCHVSLTAIYESAINFSVIHESADFRVKLDQPDYYEVLLLTAERSFTWHDKDLAKSLERYEAAVFLDMH